MVGATPVPRIAKVKVDSSKSSLTIVTVAFRSPNPNGSNRTVNLVTWYGGTDNAGIVITEAEWTNQTPSAVNLTISSTPAEDGSGNTTYEAVYEFVDAQGDNDSSTVMWFVNGTYATNTSTYSAALTNGSVLSVRVTPHDGLYTGSSVDAELVIVVSES